MAWLKIPRLEVTRLGFERVVEDAVMGIAVICVSLETFPCKNVLAIHSWHLDANGPAQVKVPQLDKKFSIGIVNYLILYEVL